MERKGSCLQVRTGKKTTARARDEGNTAFIILSKTKPNTKLYLISWREASRLFFFLKCSTHTHAHAHTHTSSATNSHNYLYESWTGRSPISVKGPVFFFVFFFLTSACAGFQRRKTAAVLKKEQRLHIFTSSPRSRTNPHHFFFFISKRGRGDGSRPDRPSPLLYFTRLSACYFF